jgi:L-ascorbate metabolism protein UlaG (beta-lactamase superfamily)
MTKAILAFIIIVMFGMLKTAAIGAYEKDVIKTSAGDLEITFIGHASLMFKFNSKIIHIDPCGEEGDYSKLPKADMVLFTHDHTDHMDPVALKNVRTNNTAIVYTKKCAAKVSGGTVMNNGDVKTILGIKIEAVPAFNIMHKRGDGQPFHPKGEGNGYLMTFGDKRVYIAGDTENTPEVKALKNIDVAFLPMNLPYTMTPEMVADASKAFKPKLVYPYHFGETDTSKLVNLLKGSGIEVRIRKMK